MQAKNKVTNFKLEMLSLKSNTNNIKFQKNKLLKNIKTLQNRL